MAITYPIDRPWITWTLSFMQSHTGAFLEVSTNALWDVDEWEIDVWEAGGATQGTAESPNIDLGSTNVAYVMKWEGAGKRNTYMTLQYKTADTEAGLLNQDYETIQNGIQIPLRKRKRFIKIFITLRKDDQSNNFPLTSLTIETCPASTIIIYDNVGLSKNSAGRRPTLDHKFKGRYYQCAICGRRFRRPDMAKQNGNLVCKATCQDDRQEKRSDIQKRGK